MIIIIDPAKRAVIVNGQAHRPPRRVFDLIATLSARPGIVWSRSRLLDALGIGEEASDRAIDAAVKRSRAFLRALGCGNCIRYLYHEGYYWEDGE